MTKHIFLQFTTKANKENNIQILHSNKTITTVKNIKFLGLTLDTTLNWKHHISELIPRLNKACYAIRSIKPFMSPNVLRSTYFSYAHSIMSTNHDDSDFRHKVNEVFNKINKWFHSTLLMLNYDKTYFFAIYN